jgi:hypothetical protein
MRPSRFILLAVMSIRGPAMLHAQNASVSAAGVYASLSGEDYAGINAGLGFDAQVRFRVSKGFSLGGGFQYTSHGVEGATEDFRVSGIFAEARYTFAPASTPKVRPYVGGRFAATHWSVALGGSDGSANGTAFGPVAGLLLQLRGITHLDLGLAFLALHFGDAEIGGVPQANTNTSGSTMAFRAGLVIAP